MNSLQDLIDLLAVAIVLAPITAWGVAVIAAPINWIIRRDLDAIDNLRRGLRVRIVAGIRTVIACSAAWIFCRYFVIFFERFISFPFVTLSGIGDAYDLIFLASADPFLANLLAVRFTIVVMFPYFFFSLCRYFESRSDARIVISSKVLGIVFFYLGISLGAVAYPLLLMLQFGDLSDLMHNGMRYAEKASNFTVATGFLFAAWYVSGLLARLGVFAAPHRKRILWPFTLSPLFGTAGFLILYQLSSSTPLDWFVSVVVIVGMGLSWVAGIVFARLFSS